MSVKVAWRLRQCRGRAGVLDGPIGRNGNIHLQWIGSRDRGLGRCLARKEPGTPAALSTLHTALKSVLLEGRARGSPVCQGSGVGVTITNVLLDT